jgi:hypothetical protein
MVHPATQSFSHSAKVAATLVVGGQRIALRKVSPELLYFAQGSSFEPGPATVELQIDGKLRLLNVRILHPVVPFSDEVAIRQV